MERSSGILLHITSLSSKGGIGTLGKEAYKFVDFLASAKQTYWQMLPIHPTGYGNSPYQALSAFAGNPCLIDPELLVGAGLLKKPELPAEEAAAGFEAVKPIKMALFAKAFSRFQPTADYRSFCAENEDWLEEFALYMALKEHFGDQSWDMWPRELRMHRASAVESYRSLLAQRMEFQKFLQYVFECQWNGLHAYAAKKGVRLLGDLPIYVPYDSADVWSKPELFQLTATHRPKKVAGVPPDYFCADGQLWGHPVYDWAYMAKDGYSWWLRRCRMAARRYDAVRIDHFRGLESYWAVPARNKTARKGAWEKGPGMKLIAKIKAECPQTMFIAEDLGLLTEAVRRLVKKAGFPGMKVLEFAFDPSQSSTYLPHKIRENSICYLGTHDNETLYQWCAGISPECEEYTRKYLKIGKNDDLPQTLLQAGLESRAMLFVAQMQDYLHLGGEARMNEPGICKPENWVWRMASDALTPALAEEIARKTEQSGRAPGGDR